jgi:hypothetical protein
MHKAIDLVDAAARRHFRARSATLIAGLAIGGDGDIVSATKGCAS